MLKKIFYGLIVVLLFANNVFANIVAPISTSVPSITNPTTVTAIDLDNNGIINTLELLSGRCGILLLNISAEQKKYFPNAIQVEDYLVIPNQVALALLDEDKNGLIEPLDSVFNNLAVLTIYQEGKRYRIVTLNKIGIRAIVLHQGNTQIKSIHPVGKKNPTADKAIMSNSSTRLVETFIIDKNIFDALKSYQRIL